MKLKLKKPDNKSVAEYIFIGIIFVIMIILFVSFQSKEYSYHRYETSTTHYVRGVVTEIVDQQLTMSGTDGEYFTGKQTLKVEILEGDTAGEVVEIDNYVTVQHNVVVKEGSGVIVCADMPENAEPYYTIYNYDRNNYIWILSASFLLLVIIIGRKKGFMSCLGLIFTLCMVMCYLLPNLYDGNNAVISAIVTVVSGTAVTCFCISGFSKKTVLNIIGATVGGISAGLIYYIFMTALNISGCSMDEAESLVLISQSTGLQIKGVLFAGIMISSLGAVMDVAVSLGASLSEIKELNPEITAKELFHSGMNIGRDMIGTMTNTLILAFAGSSLATLIVLISYGVQFNQLLSSDYIALEVAKGLAGSASVVLTVPISAAVCAVGYGKHKLKDKKQSKK
ncbi:MAG: YibE/F family protein [Acutalibacteraceae bacterium]|nr:YibE/F family protein [Acutalibacteraceae bacterium]